MKITLENRDLKSFACDSNLSRGRIFKDEPLQFNRTQYQRDRDRILHCEAFRRLKQKTQVFVNFQSDHVRTRLTHTIEVAQLARSISRYLQVNDDLSEAIALAHDLGHPPYGHAGENALSLIMNKYDGFNHNEQTIRIVMFLENEYINFNGLNLTYETLDGLIKHNGRFSKKKPIPKFIKHIENNYGFKLYNHPTIEAQIANICDDIAYVSHDLNDGLNSSLLNIEEIEELPIIGQIIKHSQVQFSKSNDKVFINQITRNLINLLVSDLVKNSMNILKENKFKTPEEIVNFHSLVVKFNENTFSDFKKIKTFLLNKMYNNKKILNDLAKVNEKIKKMFEFFIEYPLKLPKKWHFYENTFILDIDQHKKSRLICNYISGMTDTYFDLKFKNLKLG